MPKTEVLREAEEVLCCGNDEHELVPLKGVIRVACTPEGMKKISNFIKVSGREMFEVGRTGDPNYCPICNETKVGYPMTLHLDFCPDCKCKLNEKKKGETQAQCPQCKQFFQAFGD